MRLVTFAGPQGERVGAFLDGDSSILDLKAAGGGNPAFEGMLALIDGGDAALDHARELVDRRPEQAVLPTDQVQLRAPLMPRRVWGAPISNLDGHMVAAMDVTAERMAKVTGKPIEEHKKMMAGILAHLRTLDIISEGRDHLYIAGPDELITAPSFTKDFDFELEVGCVIGKLGKDIPLESAAEHIFGYTIYNDWSARDEQVLNFIAGKGMSGTAKEFDQGVSLGPCIVTRDEVDIYNSEATARVNGEVIGRANTDEHSHTFEEYVHKLSRGRTIYPGEVWCGGTLHGCCMLEHDRSLPDGAVVELELEGVGVLRNRIRYSPAV